MVTGIVCALVPANRATRGPGPSFARARREHQDGNVLVALYESEQTIGRAAMFDHQFRYDAGEIVHELRGMVQQTFRRLVRFLAHDVFHAFPLLEIALLRDAQKRDMAARMLRTARGETQCDGTFGRLVDDDEEFARMVSGIHFGNFAFN